MSRFKRIICLYLSAALIIGAVIIGFGTENIAVFNISGNVDISDSSKPADPTTQNTATEETLPIVTEITTAEVTSAVKTTVETVTEATAAEIITEAVTAAPITEIITEAVTEATVTEITTEATTMVTTTVVTTTETVTTETTTEVVTEATPEAVTVAPATEATTEALSEAPSTEAATEAPATEAEAEEITDDDIITFDEILEVAPVLYKSDYSPASSNEKVSELSFLSATKDSLSSAKTSNVYTFAVEKRSMFSFRIAHPAPSGMEGWEISLYGEYYINGDGKDKDYRLLTTLKTGTGKLDKSPEIGLAPGNYRLVVKKGSSFTNVAYEIEAVLKATTEYEVECNDNIYRYNDIYSGTPVKGSASAFLDRQDEDYYLFRMYEDGFIDLKFEHGTVKDKVSVCWQVLLFSEDGTCMFSVNSLFTDTINKSGKIGLTKGNYYILVRNRVYTDMTYTLTVSRTDNKDYESEKNDTIEKANLIGVNSTVSGAIASQITGIDRDYFKFTLDTNGWTIIEFSHEAIEDSDDKNGWNITLLDEEGNMLYRGISAWSDDVVASSMIGLAKGTYYIKIDSENIYHNSEKYYLTVNFTESADCETEFNNAFNAADTINSQIPVSGFVSERDTDYDVDFYILEITEKSDVKIEFSHEKLSSSRDIFNFTLYNFKRQKIASVDKNGKESDVTIKSLADKEKTVASYKDLPAGKYYIKVTPGIFYSDIQYTLTFTEGE